MWNVTVFGTLDNIGNRQPRLLPFDANAYRLSPGMPPSVGLTAHFDISDHFIGFVIGKQGATLQTIQQQSGAKLQVSGKGEFVPGTENRRVTISGSHSSVQMAHVLLQQKVREIENLTSQKSRRGYFDSSHCVYRSSLFSGGYHALGSAPRNPGITSDSMHDHSRNNRLPFVIPSLIPNGNSGNPPMPYHPHHGHQHPYLSVRGGMQVCHS